MRTIKILLAAGFLLVFGTSIHAQVQRNETYLPKFAIKTNAPNGNYYTGTIEFAPNLPWKGMSAG